MLMTVMAMISTVPVLMTMFKLKGEEGKNRAEHILGRAVSRTQLLGSYFIISIVVGFVIRSLTAVGLWSAGSVVMEDGIAFGRIYGAAMVYLPALWMMTGLAVLLVGIVPRLTGLTRSEERRVGKEWRCGRG